MFNIAAGLINILRNIVLFIRVLCPLFIVLLLLFWIQNLIHADWNWMVVLSPMLEGILEFANSICPFSFNAFGALFELKYASATVILLLFMLLANLLLVALSIVENALKGTQYVCRKAEEVAFNKEMHTKLTTQEKRLQKYALLINTSLKPKFTHEELKIDINNENKIMLDYINEKLSKTPDKFDDGFLYELSNFDSIDKVLDVVFKLINSKSKLDYNIVIQISDERNRIDETKLRNLQKLNLKNQVIMLAETAFRYRYNTCHRYSTHQAGLYNMSSDNKTREVHEFREIL